MEKGAVVEIDPVAKIAKMMEADGSMSKGGWKGPLCIHREFFTSMACRVGCGNLLLNYSAPSIQTRLSGRLSGTY